MAWGAAARDAMVAGGLTDLLAERAVDEEDAVMLAEDVVVAGVLILVVAARGAKGSLVT